MKKLLLGSLVIVLTMHTCWAELNDPEMESSHPYRFNVDQIFRTDGAYPDGATRGDLESAIEQAYTKVQEEKAKDSWRVWIQVYRPWVPYALVGVCCFVLGRLST